jgi:ABC-type nickel/cobalt efflux system permease component RcnA
MALLAVIVAAAIWLWVGGGADVVSRWATEAQRDTQNAMAGSIRAIKAGNPGALAALWGLCFTYGFVHAAGPGHGKLVIGGYGVAARVAARRLAGLAVLSSLVQGLFAIIVVYSAIWVLGWGRAQLTDLADKTMAPLSYALIVGIGLILCLRGARKLYRQLRPAPRAHHHTHADGTCSDCGHKHGPTPEEAAKATSLRDALAVIISIAIRPCTGAVFLLILTHALGLDFAGIIGALVMGLGTATFTGLVALAAVGARESTLAQVASGQGTARLLAIAEAAAGALLVMLAAQLMLRAI